MDPKYNRPLNMLIGALYICLTLQACSPSKTSPGVVKQTDGYDEQLPMKELMEHVVQPAGFGIWRASGFRMTRKGEFDLSPTTDAGWGEVENSAATVSEAGNLLLLPGRIQAPEAEWRGYVRRLMLAGKKAKAAAEAKNAVQLFEAGTELEAACSSCHTQFMPGGEGGAAKMRN